MKLLKRLWYWLSSGHPPHTPLPSIPQVRSVTVDPQQFTLEL